MSEKSKVKINPTKFQKNLNAVCWILFLAFLGYSFFAWQNLPDMIPKHFNGAGIIDAYWSKNTSFFSPLCPQSHISPSASVNFSPKAGISRRKKALPRYKTREI